MFKKGKKKSKDESASKFESRQQIAKSEAVDFNMNWNAGEAREQVDGFDENGFVSLKPEHTPTLVGPKQPCQYVGTFPVHLGMPNGEKTLETHKERTRFVKERLVTYRNAKKNVAVLLVVSSDGIKVLSQNGKRVRMAHALQRISYATCDPDFRLFAYMTHDPSPTGVGIYCHVFRTTKLAQVRDLTSLVGKAFQRAFAATKLPREDEVKMSSKIFDPVRDPAQPAKPRRWAKLEAHKSHEDSEHARMARARRVRTASKESSDARQSADVEAAKNGSVASEETRARAAAEGEMNKLQPQATGTTLTDDVRPADGEQSSTDGSPLVTRKETPSSVPQECRVATPPEMRKSQVPATENSTNNSPLSRRTVYLGEEDEDSRSRSFSAPDLPPPLPPRTETLPDPSADTNTTSTSATATTSETPDSRGDVMEAALSSTTSPVSRTSSDPNLTRFENPTPPELPPKCQTIHSSLSDPSFDLQKLSLEQLPHSESSPSHSAADATAGKTSEPVVSTMPAPEQNVVRSHQDEYWYLADIPREFVIEMLENSEEGAFFVRNSQSRPGCYALTVRVPYEVNDSGYGNYLITQEGGLFTIQGFHRSFSDLPSLIEHHAKATDGLPCRLLLSGSNVLCEDEDYVNMPSTDPDYMALSDYRDIYAELT